MIVSKIGIHSIGDKRNGYKPFLQTIADAGRQLALVKCRDDFGAVDEPLQFWPDIVTIGAKTDWDDADYDVDKAYKRITEEARKNPKIKFWECYNEQNGDYAQQADLYIALMPRLSAAGIGLCMFNSASGTPQYPHLDPAPYREVSRACAFAKAHNYRAILGLHEYPPREDQQEKDTLGRYKTLADYLQSRGALIPIAITEWGWETVDGKDQKYLAWAKAHDALYMGDDRVIGLSMFSLGGRGWQASNYQNILPQLGEYIATVQPATPQPPEPPPPPPLPEPLTLEARVSALENRVNEIEARL